MRTLHHLGVLTSGGDAPGMNAAIRSVVRSALDRKLVVTGIERGYWGLLEADFHPLTSRSVGNLLNRGGTILRTVRCPEFEQPARRQQAYAHLREAGIDALVIIGGNGSARGADVIHRENRTPVALVPASIDNDIWGTDDTVGFDTAVNTAVEAIDKIRDTATSHERVFVVEVMGRDNGFIALEVGLACGAEAVLIPEVPAQLPAVIRRLAAGHRRGKLSSIIVMAEGAGDSRRVAAAIERRSRLKVRVSVLGYIQRGGSPTAHSRLLAARLGQFAVKNLLAGRQAHLAGVQSNTLKATPLAELCRRTKRVDRSIYQLTLELAT